MSRVQCGWNNFNDLLPFLYSRAVSLPMKGEIYSRCVRPSMLHGSETWPMRQEEKNRLLRTESSMLRWMCGSKIQDRAPISSLRTNLGNILAITNQARSGWLRYVGHVERREDNDWLKRVCNLDIEGCTPRG